MNEHWQIIASGGIKVSNSAQELWQGAIKYFEWCKENPIITKKTLTSGKEAGKRVEQEYPRPYTVKGLCMHLGIMEEYLRDLRKSQDKTNLYYIVASRILYAIYTQNAEMALIGVYNPIFTAKMLNIGSDDTPTAPIKIEIVDGLPPLSSSENEILEKYEAQNNDNEII
jgi:hypothetical protein